jgi:nitroreductase
MSAHPLSARQPDHPVAPQFPDRWSPRAFSEDALSEAAVLTALEAARWAPSSTNHQPSRFVWALRGEPAHAAILAALAASNQVWAGNAAALIVVASKGTSVNRDGAEVPNAWAPFDTGAAWMSLALQALSMGLVSHAMGGFDAAALGAAVGLPENHTLHAVVALGHQGRTDILPENLQQREVPNQRRPLTETAFRGRF